MFVNSRERSRRSGGSSVPAETRPSGEAEHPASGVSRRRFLGYVMAAPVLVAAADLRAAAPAQAAIPTVQAVDLFDLSDLLTDAALMTASLITVTVNRDGTVSFALPRAEVGQGPSPPRSPW